jgi:hypothetical protein
LLAAIDVALQMAHARNPESAPPAG